MQQMHQNSSLTVIALIVVALIVVAPYLFSVMYCPNVVALIVQALRLLQLELLDTLRCSRASWSWTPIYSRPKKQPEKHPG